jgi:hypothetical protein
LAEDRIAVRPSTFVEVLAPASFREQARRVTSKPDHRAHKPGTREDCPDCVALAYEPGWYKSLREHRVVARPAAVLVPEVDAADVEVVLTEESPVEAADEHRA